MAEVVASKALKSGETPPHPDPRVVPSILVVDDQADAREMLTAFLSSCGFLVHTATDGLDAITVAQRVLPSIILMDLMMPRMDGFEATRRLKADPRTSAIPVIALTANALTNGRQVARTAGCDDLLGKPCDLDILADELRKWLTPSGYARPFRVLVVDDESPIRIFTARALTRAGYAVDAAASGPDALAIVEQEGTFDLFVLDVMMPEMEGVELARQLRVRHPDAKVLYCTGYVDHLLRDERIRWENDAILEKPVSVTGLQEAVSLLLFKHTLGPANSCTAVVTRVVSPAAPTDPPATDLRVPQPQSESADTRSINIGLWVEDAIAADLALDDAIAAAIERRDRRTDPTTLSATDPRAPQQHSESADTRSINIDNLSVEDAIAADIAVDDAFAAAIERRDRRTDPTT